MHRPMTRSTAWPVLATVAASVWSSGRAFGQTVELVPPGEGLGFGISVTGVPDLDGDGWGDVAVGAPQFALEGRVFVFTGRTGSYVRTLASPMIPYSHGFGPIVCGIHDLNGDHLGEILVAAPGDGIPASPTYAGRVHAFSGASGGVLYSLLPESQTNEISFAGALATVPDLDGDGVDDFIVGSEGEFSGAGAAYVFSGATGARVHLLFSPQACAFCRFGNNVAGTPDLDGDGRGDVVVYAPREPVEPGSTTYGVLYVFSGAGGTVLHRIPMWTSSLAGVADLDGDGLGDIIVGQPWFTVSAAVLSGATGEVIRIISPPMPIPPQYGDFGASVAAIPDLDGDGLPEILIGAPTGRVGNLPLRPGAAHLYSGATGARLRTFGSPHPMQDGAFAYSLAPVSDANGDGRSEIVIGALYERPATGEGRAYLFYSCPADMNADGRITSQDFFDFVNAFFAAEPRADFSRDGTINSQDFFDYLAAFFAGCP